SGRTHMQDAVPIRLGQEFAAYALTIRRARARIADAADGLLEQNIGATAVGTGLNAEPGYIELVVKNLGEQTVSSCAPRSSSSTRPSRWRRCLRSPLLSADWRSTWPRSPRTCC